MINKNITECPTVCDPTSEVCISCLVQYEAVFASCAGEKTSGRGKSAGNSPIQQEITNLARAGIHTRPVIIAILVAKGIKLAQDPTAKGWSDKSVVSALAARRAGINGYPNIIWDSEGVLRLAEAEAEAA